MQQQGGKLLGKWHQECACAALQACQACYNRCSGIQDAALYKKCCLQKSKSYYFAADACRTTSYSLRTELLPACPTARDGRKRLKR